MHKFKEEANNRVNGRMRNCSGSGDEPEYTQEQLDCVKRVNNFKNYYELFGLTKDASMSEINKAYKILILKIHPDKNKAPGSAAAFRGLKKAHDDLQNPEIRKKYDAYLEQQQKKEMQYEDLGIEDPGIGIGGLLLIVGILAGVGGVVAYNMCKSGKKSCNRN